MKKVVLVGGCFDILHPGHIIFLEKAKAAGDSLVVLLESDQKVKELKGQGRPIHTQKERAKLLQALRSVDQVVMLPYLDNEEDYDEIVAKIKPHIIAATYGDTNIHHYQRAAKLIDAKLRYVTKMVGNYSSSRILGGYK
ncbi:adenylyltransferase/cytidyltransferase family protein [Candidatus Daviesbacteria bacterium]|nr:adenylyltransferase/cytidyltransferase family protein [Candidatus Daviesbacteria bacterium]